VAVGADAAVTKVADTVGSKAGVKGIGEIAQRPRSVKAWAKAGARTGISWAINLAAPGAGGKVEEVLNTIGYKRLAMIVVSLAMIPVVAGGVLIVGAAATVDQVLKPTAVIASVLKMLPGMGDDEDPEKVEQDIREIGRVCGPVPVPERVLTDGQDQESTSSFIPKPVIDDEGKATPEVKDAMKLIPPDADPLQAETWMVYRFSHPDDDPHRDWGTFKQIYDPAYSLVAEKRGEPTDDVDGPRTDITPAELLMNIDPYGIYPPFYLAAASSVAYLGVEKWFDNITEDQMAAVMGRAVELCGV